MANTIKKIDLHIHTLPNEYLDADFEFDMTTMKDYVAKNSFDAVAITNHNRFNKDQFLAILTECAPLGCTCFPGIEISLEGGHILVIGDADDESYAVLRSLSEKAEGEEHDDHYSMSAETLNSLIAGKNVLLIPHYYGKTPSIPKSVVDRLSTGVHAGEAGNQKKFFLAKRSDGPTPVCFSDIRIKKGTTEPELCNYDKLTYVRIVGDITVSSLKTALADKTNVAVGKSFLDETFDILEGKAEASGGINVLIGERSSGKTYTLDRIYDSLGGADNPDVLYIKQFEIQQQVGDIRKNLQSFATEMGKDYSAAFRDVLEYMDRVEIGEKEGRVSRFLESLKKHAESSKEDEYSKAALYSFSPDEVIRGASKTNGMRKHVEALIDAESPLSEVISKHLDREKLILLFKELLSIEKREEMDERIKSIAERIAKSVSDCLTTKSVSVPIEGIDFSSLFQTRYVRKCFDKLVAGIKKKTIADDDIFGRFRRVTTVGPIPTKREMKTLLGIPQGTNVDYLYAESKTDAYLRVSAESPSQHATGELRWRYFLNVDCQVKNSHGADLSGGQSAEYCLLDKLRSHRKYQYVLIDELEPSFDNPFLNGQIVPLLHEIAESATVFVSTHNNNLGVSLHPDQYMFHRVKDTPIGTQYRVFYGPASGKTLHDASGEELPLSEVLITTMEAGETAYNERRNRYENHED